MGEREGESSGQSEVLRARELRQVGQTSRPALAYAHRSTPCSAPPSPSLSLPFSLSLLSPSQKKCTSGSSSNTTHIKTGSFVGVVKRQQGNSPKNCSEKLSNSLRTRFQILKSAAICLDFFKLSDFFSSRKTKSGPIAKLPET